MEKSTQTKKFGREEERVLFIYLLRIKRHFHHPNQCMMKIWGVGRICLNNKIEQNTRTKNILRH